MEIVNIGTGAGWALKCLGENSALVPKGRMNLAQDAVLGGYKQCDQSRKGRLKTLDEVSAVPTGLVQRFRLTQDCVLG